MNYYNNNISDSDDEDTIVYMEDEHIDQISFLCLIHCMVKTFYYSDYISIIINEYLFRMFFLIPILYYLSIYIYMDSIDMKKTVIIMYVTISFINLYDLSHQCYV